MKDLCINWLVISEEPQRQGLRTWRTLPCVIHDAHQTTWARTSWCSWVCGFEHLAEL